ncbi:MAG: hypothetical protein IRZ00_17475 [Gemmatimonadetes bacterium]|nr:hypothetical protein [Gemmatimonadota bacterium]
MSPHRSFVDSVSSPPYDILVNVDRPVVAASLETRAPSRDCRVVEFEWRLSVDLPAPAALRA